MLDEILEFEEYSFKYMDHNRLSIKSLKNAKSGLKRALLIICRYYLYLEDEINESRALEAMKYWSQEKEIIKYPNTDSFLYKYISSDKDYKEDVYNNMNLNSLNRRDMNENSINYESILFISKKLGPLKKRYLVSDFTEEELKELLNISTPAKFNKILKLTAYYLINQLYDKNNIYESSGGYSNYGKIIKVDYSNWCGVKDPNQPFKSLKEQIRINNQQLIKNYSNDFALYYEWVKHFELVEEKQLNDSIDNKSSYYVDRGSLPLEIINLK